MEQAIEQIKTALINSLSMDQNLRDQANLFLIKQCEPDPQFQIALLHIIKSFSTVVSPNTVLDAQGVVSTTASTNGSDIGAGGTTSASDQPQVFGVANGNSAPQQPRQPTNEEIQI